MSNAARTLTGIVLDTATGKPIAGAFVHAADQRNTVRTNARGLFALTKVPADSLAVVAAAEGYDFTWHTLEEQAEGIILRLTPAEPKSVPHADYPRPDFDHRTEQEQWLSLNGTWSFDIDPEGLGEKLGWFAGDHEWAHAIRVPFSYTSLAGVGEELRASNVVYASQFADIQGSVWYRRTFTVPEKWSAQPGVWLRFGAVEWDSTVWVDGRQVGQHDNGYTPFDVYLGELAPGSEHVLVVRAVVSDTSRQTPYPQGKQTGWYTDTGGIWQSVWLEPGSPARLEKVAVTPHLQWIVDQKAPISAKFHVEVKASTDGTVRIALRDPHGKKIATAESTIEEGAAETLFEVVEPTLWDIGDPQLYTVEVQLLSNIGDDSVRTYAGLRSLERRWAPGHSPEEQHDPREQYQYLYLNNRPIYLRAVLDQGYTPWGGYSYTGLCEGADLRTGSLDKPGKGSILFDLHQAIKLGFNCVRMHIKVNDPRWYHWADQLGVLVWYDQPNFGYDGYGPRARELWKKLLYTSVARDYNHPSIVVWNAFNEAWGLLGPEQTLRPDAHEWIQQMSTLTKELMGPGRLYVDNSPCCSNGHIDTDIMDWHSYYSTWAEWQTALDDLVDRTYPGSTNLMEGQGVQSGQPLVNSEFGPWSGGREKDQSVAVPFDWITELFRAQPKLNGYLFTELTDVEWEWNGWTAYDRTLQLPGYTDAAGNPLGVEAINADDVLIIHGPPVCTPPPGSQLVPSVAVSWFSGPAPAKAVLRWRVSGTDELGRTISAPEWQEREVAITPYTVTELGQISCSVPAELRRGRLDAELHIDGRKPLRRWTPVVVHNQAVQARTSAGMMLIPLPLRTASTMEFSSGGRVFTAQNGATGMHGHGDGSLVVTMDVPHELIAELPEWTRSQLVVEVSACQPGVPRTRFPQTSERRYPTAFRVSVNGVSSEELILPDAMADSRGAVAGHSDGPYASCGYRTVVELDADATREALSNGKITIGLHGRGGGLLIFGASTGQFGITPQLVLATNDAALTPGLEDAPADQLSGLGAGVSVHLEPGPAMTIVTVVNDTLQPVYDVRTELRKAQDELVQPESAPDIDELAPGQAWHVRYKTTEGRNHKLRPRAYWTEQGNRLVVEQPSIEYMHALGSQASLH